MRLVLLCGLFFAPKAAAQCGGCSDHDPEEIAVEFGDQHHGVVLLPPGLVIHIAPKNVDP